MAGTGLVEETNDGSGDVTVNCPVGDVATGGGFLNSMQDVVGSFPSGGTPPTSWTVDANGDESVTAYVLCLPGGDLG